MTDSFACRFSDKRFSALGFGARIPPNYEVSPISILISALLLFVYLKPHFCSIPLTFSSHDQHYAHCTFMCSYLILVFSNTLGLYVEPADLHDLFYDTIHHSVKISHLKLIIEFIFIHKPLVLKYQLVLRK